MGQICHSAVSSLNIGLGTRGKKKRTEQKQAFSQRDDEHDKKGKAEVLPIIFVSRGTRGAV